MAKSKIIKDLANGTVDTMTALKRAKLLFAELGNEELTNWINYEIAGYPSDVDVPNYRKTRGRLTGSYFKGSIATHIKYTNVSLPLGKMPDDVVDRILNIEFRDGVDALRQLLDDGINKKTELGASLPADCFRVIAHYNNDPFMNIISARTVFGSQEIRSVFAAVENKLLDALMLLEKEFGILDDLDFDTSTVSEEELQNIANRITVIIYNDNSVSIGNNNRMKDTTIASVLNSADES